jgi:hypothetical protein
MERCKDRHCRRGAAALLFGLRRPGAVPPVSSRPRTQPASAQAAGFFLTWNAVQKTAAQWQYAAGKVAQAEVVSRLSHASVVFCDPFLNIPSDIGRRDSARPARASIQAEGYPMADTAVERVSEAPQGHRPV